MRQKVSTLAYRRLNTVIQKLNMLSCVLCESNNTSAMKEIEEIEYQLLAIHSNWILADKEIIQDSIRRKKRLEDI